MFWCVICNCLDFNLAPHRVVLGYASLILSTFSEHMFELAAAGTGVSRSTCDVDIKRPYISLSYPQCLT